MIAHSLWQLSVSELGRVWFHFPAMSASCLKLPPLDSVVALCFAVPVCKTCFFLDICGSSKVNVAGNLKKFKSLSETLSVLASLNFWNMCLDSCKCTLNNWTSLSLLKRLEEPTRVVWGHFGYILPTHCHVYCSRWPALTIASKQRLPMKLAEYTHSLQFFWVLQNFFQARES